MVQIIQEKRQPKFMDRLATGIGAGFEEAGRGLPQMFGERLRREKEEKETKAENEYLSKLTGMDFSHIKDPETKKILLQSYTKRKQEDENVKQQAVRSVDDMRQILARGHTGMNVFNMVTEEGRGDRAALDTAALNLERLAADMVGKGTLSQERFKYLKKRLPSGFKTDAENNAILDEWEKILSDAGEKSEEKTKEKKSGKQKFDSQNPEHKAKAQQLFKKLKDKEKVREALRREFEL